MASHRNDVRSCPDAVSACHGFSQKFAALSEGAHCEDHGLMRITARTLLAGNTPDHSRRGYGMKEAWFVMDSAIQCPGSAPLLPFLNSP